MRRKKGGERTIRKHLVQTALASALGSKRLVIAFAAVGILMAAGMSSAALYGFGPAEAWTNSMIGWLTSYVLAQIAAMKAVFMLQSQIRFEQLISAVAVATKQEGLSANQIVDSTRNAGQTLVNAVRAQRVNDATVQAYLDYSPATGQGYDVCGTVMRNRTLDQAFNDASGAARRLMSDLDVAPGKLVDSRVKAMAARLDTHRQKFCTPSEAEAGLCKLGKVPGGDTNAGLLFQGVEEDSDESLARKQFIQNMVGDPDEKIQKTAGKSPAGQTYLFEKNRKDALMSIPAYSLAMIDANNTRTNEYENKSPNEIMRLRVNQYFGGKEAQKWSSSMAAQTSRGLIVEATKMAGLEVWMRHRQYEQGQRMEANLAALLLTSTDGLQADVDMKHQATLQQNAASQVKP